MIIDLVDQKTIIDLLFPNKKTRVIFFFFFFGCGSLELGECNPCNPLSHTPNNYGDKFFIMVPRYWLQLHSQYCRVCLLKK